MKREIPLREDVALKQGKLCVKHVSQIHTHICGDFLSGLEDR